MFGVMEVSEKNSDNVEVFFGDEEELLNLYLKELKGNWKINILKSFESESEMFKEVKIIKDLDVDNKKVFLS